MTKFAVLVRRTKIETGIAYVEGSDEEQAHSKALEALAEDSVTMQVDGERSGDEIVTIVDVRNA